MMNVKIIDRVECYGKLCDDSNFVIVCDDEYYDAIWCEGNPYSEDGTFSSWREVVKALKERYRTDIIEISAV
jgi:hypothetical protein